MNKSSTLWLMNVVSSVFFVLLLFDVIISLILLVIGSIIGILVFQLQGITFHYAPGFVSLGDIIATLAAAIFIGSIFSGNKQIIEGMKRRTIKVEADNQAKALYIEELQKAKEAAEVANVAKSALISNMGHDLKSPFNGIQGCFDVLRTHYNEQNPELKQLWDLTFAGIIEIRAVLDAIIDFIAMKNPALKFESFSLNQTMEDIKSLLLPTAISKNLHLIIHKLDPKETDLIETDKLRLLLILNILVSNAIKFTDKGTISITVLRKDDYFHVQIADTGIGIPKDKFAYIFEPFTKLSLSNTHNTFQGIGGGLFSAQKKAEDLTAIIEVESELGKGSTFTLIIPACAQKKQ